MKVLKAVFGVFRDAGVAWGQDKASIFAAAIAYYMVFSIAPLLVLTISIAGRFFGQAAVAGEIVTQVEHLIGSEAAVLLQGFLKNAQVGSSGFTIISTAILLWAASGVFNHLKRALDFIYGVIPRQLPPLQGAWHMLRTRALTFAMVFLMGFLLLGAFALNTVASALGEFVNGYFPQVSAINTYVTQIIAPLVMVLLFATLFKMLPDARIAWRDVWLGSLVTTLLVWLGVYFIGLYLSIANVGSVYGAAGSLIVILVWIYYSTQILMFGAEFTKIFAVRYGRGIEPRSKAITLAEFYNNLNLENPDEEEEEGEESYLPEPIIEQPPMEIDPYSPANQTRKQVAAGFIGLAVGLFLGFISQIFQDD